MKFLLYCDGDPRALGIEDVQGNQDLVKLREHIRKCPDCQRLYVLLGKDILDDLIAAHAVNQA